MQDFGPRGGGVDGKVFKFSCAKGPKRRQRRRFRKFSRFFENCTKSINTKSTSMHLNDISDGPIFVSGRSKNLKFSPGR